MAEIPVRSSGVSVVILREVGAVTEVLLLRRNHTLVGEWCQIAGGVEQGEKAWETAVREVKEETGLTCSRLYSADICEQFYDVERDVIAIAPVFVGFVDPNAPVILNNEHSDFRWCAFATALEMVTFAGQRHVLRHVEAEFVQKDPVEHLLINHRAV